MVLGVKESVSGKRIALAANGDEADVCGGKGAVYLSGTKVALRCCGKTSIVATRKLKQSVLRQGDVALLDLRYEHVGCVLHITMLSSAVQRDSLVSRLVSSRLQGRLLRERYTHQVRSNRRRHGSSAQRATLGSDDSIVHASHSQASGTVSTVSCAFCRLVSCTTAQQTRVVVLFQARDGWSDSDCSKTCQSCEPSTRESKAEGR